MSFILYYILRKFFVYLKFSDKAITLRKGLLFRRVHIIPKSSITRITCVRSPLLRLFRAKEVTVFTLNGSFKLFLRRDEQTPFTPKPPKHFIKPRLGQIAFGTFIDVRALGGILVFAAVLRRIGTIFGGKYLDNILRALDTATENVESMFAAAKLYVPRVTAALGVFALAAWAFAYLKRLTSLLRFQVGISKRGGESIIVRSGLFTLYEHTLVRYNAAAALVDSPLSLAAKRAPIYLRDVMIYPCADRKSFAKLSRIILGEEHIERGKSRADIRPPKRAVFGYCAVPIFWSGAFAALLMTVYRSTALRGAMLIRTALFCGLFVSLYTVILCLFYIKHSRLVFGERLCSVTARRSFRLYTAVFRKDTIIEDTLSQSVFQRRSGLCNYKISTSERRSFISRQLPRDRLR